MTKTTKEAILPADQSSPTCSTWRLPRSGRNSSMPPRAPTPRRSRRPLGPPRSPGKRRAPDSKMSKFTPRERAELVKNDGQLGQGARSQDRQDGAAADAGGECLHRGAAVRPGRLDRSRRRPMRSRKSNSGGFQLKATSRRMWPRQFSRVEGSPSNDIRVRKAANPASIAKAFDGRSPA